MRGEIRRTAFRFAVFAAVSLALLVLLVNTMRNGLAEDGRTFSAAFTDVSGLRVGDDVKVAGVRVGRVDTIEVSGRGAVVEFELADEQPILDTTRVVMRYQNLIGQRYLALEQGPQRGEELEAGASIAEDMTSPGFDLTELLNGFRPLFEVLDPADVNALATSIVQVLQGEGGTIEQLLRQTTSLSTFVADRDQLIGSVLEGLTPVLADLEDQDEEFTGAVGDLRTLMTGLARERRSIGASIDGVGSLVEATSELLDEARAPAVETARQLRRAGGAPRRQRRRAHRGPALLRRHDGHPGPHDVLRERAQHLPLLVHRQHRARGTQPRGRRRSLVGGVPMKPLQERDPFRIGLVALAALAALGLAVVLLSVLSFGTSTYTAVLSQTAGLRAGESVQVAGVVVGKVRSVELRDTDVAVTFTIEEGLDLGSLTTAEVKVATLLGTHYLQVDPQGEGSLEDDTIPLERTSVPYNLEDVLEQGTDRLEALDAPLLAEALTEVSRTLGRSGEELGPALEGVGRLSEVIATRSEQTGDLLGAIERVSVLLQEDSADVLELMETSSLVFREITDRRVAINRLLARTTRLATTLTAIVEGTRADLGPALRDLDTALAGLREEDEALQDVLTTMAPAVRYVANATGNGPWADLFLRPPALPADDQRCAAGDCS